MLAPCCFSLFIFLAIAANSILVAAFCPECEVFNEAAVTCLPEPTCENPIPSQLIDWEGGCLPEPRCECDATLGFIRDSLGNCISQNECPCGCNEYLEECASACFEPTCLQPEPPPGQFCILVCVQRCLCIEGYIRDNATKLCIPLNECPNPLVKCPVNEVFNKDALTCLPEATCSIPNPIKLAIVCEPNPRCECNAALGFIRGRFGNCIPQSECMCESCIENEYLEECASACFEPTCLYRKPSDEPCIEICVQRCECIDGYIRDDATKLCIPLNECDPCALVVCPQSEIFNQNALTCIPEPTCDTPVPFGLGACFPNPRCECDATLDLIRNSSGFCVPQSECSFGRCMENEYLNECASVCFEPTCLHLEPPPNQLCIFICVQRCQCINGYIRDDATKLCIPLNECDPCPLDPFAVKGCQPCCERTCQNPSDHNCRIPCTKQCIPSCQCLNGFLQDEKTGLCVPEKNCLATDHHKPILIPKNPHLLVHGNNQKLANHKNSGHGIPNKGHIIF